MEFTYWKEGGLLSPIPPTLSVCGRSAVCESADCDCVSEESPTTSWNIHKQKK